MEQSRIKYLLQQFAARAITADEQQELEQLLAASNRDELVEDIAMLAERDDHSSYMVTEETAARTFSNILAADKTNTAGSTGINRMISRRWFSAAAVVLLLLSAGAWFIFSRRQKPPSITQVKLPKPEKEPGRNTAILTLADSSQVEIDSLGNITLPRQGGSQVLVKDKQLAYIPQPGGDPATIAYNTISTPRGGEFTVTLSDGTKVWLNAASSLQFPTTFTGAKREVELTGEAYLAVAEDKDHPFEVKIRNVNVAVLGTQFNINGYEDENSIVTTLVSGAVRITAPGNQPRILAPGDHAVVENNAGYLHVEKADIEEETAWKNGRTYFNGANIRQIMRQVSRWYNVDVQYKGNVANMDFTCTVSRKDKLSKLLALLELTGAVNFTMEGNTIIVQP
ncbi:FecR family protein [Paraflavitalea speifideaquila]|uniref:FecR family protein n=1 Tax=Paraflavitalea speifideaquila TaxID=3076558 RepID=UPI0028E59860|nr:FecR domain-containing protein [Paraflavitalea speifideiaquila]